MRTWMDKRYPVTNGLLLLTTVVFLLMQVLRFGQATSAGTIYEFGGLYGDVLKVDISQFWRLLSPIFVHIGWQHFFFNSITLYSLGYQLEPLFGSKRFFLLYLLSGLMGNVFVLFFTPNVIVAGASTSLFGLFGAMALLRYGSRTPYLRVLGQRYTALLVLNLMLGFFNPAVSMAGHLGGAVGGCLTVIFLPPLLESRLFSRQQKFLALLGYLVLLVGMIALSLFYLL
ncbi:rhomboid family intramembrane serine protease [Streptococcus oriscaviae]|uniref:Rhomboid family intramembrane serine protease n=1 Tax=Streptococcus oriscaviae TaxID=2781599 RepID=A0ABX7YIW1_9STRE|nr:rhomboid family intramembrane serine protease [Streptococcus oriscaviae]QUE53741.1 rhomboid family intramembrane serine protease [Streptococcus oriscaviae]